MEPYIFLFLIALAWTIFATVQDLRTREISNWLNFSLVAFALAYRGLYSIAYQDWKFFVLGVIGFGLFFVLANVFYYARVFAGGDAKLLMAYGVILPFGTWSDFFWVSLTFIFLLFLVGAAYSLIYSVFLVSRNWKKFKREFGAHFGTRKSLLVISVIFALALFLISIFRLGVFWLSVLPALFLISIPFLYSYLRALEKSCMVKKVEAKILTEGDWLERDIRVGNRVIAKSVHGLSLEEIKILQKANKRVWIKEGIPFTPAFFLALIIMVCVFLTSGFHLMDWALSLF